MARLTDWHLMWENALNKLNTNSNSGFSRFFVDAMHMASGQSNFSNLAKYNCITWSGSTYQEPNPTIFSGIFGSSLSAWTYPPVKKWWTEITENELEATKRTTSSGNLYSTGTSSLSSSYGGGGFASVFNTISGFGRDIITTSHLFDRNEDWTYFDDTDPDGANHKNVGLQIDGFVGSTQIVSRSRQYGKEAENHINGLEGFVTTNDYHVNGPRRWFSGMDGKEYGVGKNTSTYGKSPDGDSAVDPSEQGKHFMHLSYFAPGKDLHNNEWHLDNPILYGEDTWMDNLQGIWGGGVFGGKRAGSKFGSDSDPAKKHYHLPMEGNYAAGEDKTYKVYREAPGPGVGYGYDLKYRELHERQWDPTFSDEGDPDNKIRDFIRNIYPGSKFIFHHKDTQQDVSAFQDKENIYTIKKVHIKKLYNHTNWRSHYNIWWDNNGGYHYNDIGSVQAEYRSV